MASGFVILCVVVVLITLIIEIIRIRRYAIRINRRMAAMRHLYTAFWRPDILEHLQSNHTQQAALCGLVLDTNDMTANLAECDCPACRETFLEALPTGSGKRMTYEQYLADVAKQAKQRAELEVEKRRKANEGWSTTKPDITRGWSTGKPDGWRT